MALAFAATLVACAVGEESAPDAAIMAGMGGNGGMPVAGKGDNPAGSGGSTAGSGGSRADASDIDTSDAGEMLDASEPILPPRWLDHPMGDRGKTVDDFACPGGSTIVSGMNSMMVGDKARTFIADFPTDKNAPMGILFSWHGYNQAEGDHHKFSNLNPNGNPEKPVVVITPDDIEFELPVGLDWQLDEGTPEKNVDLAFFEAMVGCLNQQFTIVPTRIYSLGYSAGSVMTALIHSVYPRIMNVGICISGMWWNDQKQVDSIFAGGLVLHPTWPPLYPEDGGTILLTHGGNGDAVAIVNLETMAQHAFPFLKEGGRVVVDCAHDKGHVGHPDVTPPVISKFITENSAAELSPYLMDGGYAGWPSSCMLRKP